MREWVQELCMLVIMRDGRWLPACWVVGLRDTVKAVNTQWVSCLGRLFSAAQGACWTEEVEDSAHVVGLELWME